MRKSRLKLDLNFNSNIEKIKFMFRANFQRTGVYSTLEVHQLNGLKWQSRKAPDFLTWCFGFDVAEGIVCVGNRDRNLYGLDSETGQQLWAHQLGEKFFSSPVIFDGIVYVSSLEFNGATTHQYLRAIDIKSGQQLWKFILDFQPSSLLYGSVPSSPVVSQGKVYIGGTDGYLYGIDISSAESGWSFKTTKNMPLTPPALKNDIICVASGDGYLYAIELSTGQQKWKYEIGGLKPFSPSYPAISNQSVYIISSDNTLHSLNLQTGELCWTFKDRGMHLYAPIVSEQAIYIGGSNTSLCALDINTGEILRTFPTGNMKHRSNPVMAGNTIYIGGQGFLQALDSDTGEELWQFTTPLPENIMLEPQWLIGKLGEQIFSKLTGAEFNTEKFSTPIINNGMIYAGCKNGYLYALN